MRFDADRIWERVPKANFCFLGWGIFSIWNNLMYRFPPVSFPCLPSHANVWYEAVIVAVMVALAVLSRCVRGFAPLVRRPHVVSTTVALLLACTCANYGAAALSVSSPALMWASLVAGGVGTALMMMLLSEFFGFIHPRRTVLYLSLGWLVGSVATPFFRVLPLGHLWAAMAAIPVVLALCLWRSYKTLSGPELSFMAVGRAGRASFPWVALVPVVLCIMVKTALSSLLPGGVDMELANDGGMMLAALVLLVGLALFGGDLNLRSIWKAGVGAMAAAIVLFVMTVALGADGLGLASATLSMVSYSMLFILMAAILANMSYRHGVCALWLFSIEHAAHLVARNAASVAMDGLAAAGLPDLAVYAGFTVFAVASMLVVAWLFTRYSPDSLWGLSIREEGSFGEAERLGAVCDELTDRFGLTARESEILFMCLQEKRPQTIASDLLIEVSTVRTHVKHLYAKLGIHSKEELRQLAES